MARIKAKINVTRVKWNEQQVAHLLATDARVQPQLMAKAQAIATDAATRVAAAPKRKVAKQRVRGFYFSERPDAIAKEIKVNGQEGPYIVTKTGKGRDLPVALVVADHPYSPYYLAEFASAIAANVGGAWKVRRP